ncbi:MAG: hypothetical protein K2N73_11670 [Lachnospiraceae bacterium]|nr:hypothetical protein [Lachnospiraceae bacterium]
MKSLLDIQKEVKELEAMVQDMANSLDCISREIQEIRTSNDNMEMDYDMIRMLAKNVPFANHPLAKLKDGYACKLYIELLLSVMQMDTNGITEKMVFIQWILKESRIDMELEDVYAESLELEKEIYSEIGEILRTDFRRFFIVDALIVANFVEEANGEAIEYIAQLCVFLGVDASYMETSVILAKIALYQDIKNIKKADVEEVLPYIDDYEYCIGKNTIEKAFCLFRYVCIKVYNDDLWGGYSLSWKVKQISKVSKGDNIAEYRPKQGSTTYVKASQDGTLFQFKAEKTYSYGSVGVISHPSDSGKKIEQWLTKRYEGENVTFKFIDESSNRFW